jgi:hypothetical protein
MFWDMSVSPRLRQLNPEEVPMKLAETDVVWVPGRWAIDPDMQDVPDIGSVRIERSFSGWRLSWRRCGAATISTARVCQLAEAPSCSTSASAPLPAPVRLSTTAQPNWCRRSNAVPSQSRRPQKSRASQ